MKKILITYASKAGSTVEVAQAVAEALKEKGFQTELVPAGKVKDVGGYDGVVFGSAVRMGKPVGEAMRFVNKFGGRLAGKAVAVFSVGLAMKDDTAEGREETLKAIAPVTEALKPVSLAMFGGKLDYSTLSPLFRFMFSRDTSGKMVEGDWRNWDSIREWGGSLATYFA